MKRTRVSVNRLLITATFLAIFHFFAFKTASADIFINEIHYDNSGSDVFEFVEVENKTGILLIN